MDSPVLIANLKFMQVLKMRNNSFFAIAEEVYKRAEIHLANRIPALFPEYTQHDIHHSIRIIENIENLVSDVDALNEFEILLIIVCCLLHDTGMGIDSSTIEDIISNSSGLTDIKFEAMVEKFLGDDKLALQELVRIIHGDLSESVIEKHYKDLFLFKDIGNLSFHEDIILISKSHTKDHIWIDSNLKKRVVKGKYEYNPHYLSILLRLGDILDFDGRRTPLLLYNIIRPRATSDKEWTQHFIVSNIDKIKLDRESHLKKIVVYGNCTDVDIHRKFLGYVDCINNELEYAVESTVFMEAKHRLLLKTKVELCIDSVGYTISNYRLNIDFRSITNLLMGEKIYGEKSLGIRELIQNSIDACKVRKEKEENMLRFGDEPYTPTVKVIFDEDEGFITIKDNGCGMDEEIIKKYFLNIGKSYYTSDDYLLRQHKYKPIGNYGIGFLSCFMLSDEVVVRTSKPNDQNRFDLALEKGSEYISFTKVEDSMFSGTEVRMDYAKLNQVLIDEKTDLQTFIFKYFINDDIKIVVIDRKNRIEKEIKHPLNNFSISSDNDHLIDISTHLKDCYGCAIVRQKKNFVYEIGDISKLKEALFYYDNELHLFTDLPMGEFINGEIIEYLNIPVYDEDMKDEFDTAFKFLDDLDEVIERVEPTSWYSLLIRKDQQSFITDNDLFRSKYDFVFDLLTEPELLNFLELDGGFIPKVYAKKELLFGNSSKTIFMPFSENVEFNRYPFSTKHVDIGIFLRDILVRNHIFKIEHLPHIFEIEKMNLNIICQKMIPDVSRNNFDGQTANSINYSVAKALLLAVADHIDLGDQETQLLKAFINVKYKDGSILID